VELVLQSSLVDAALQDLRELLVYPYGCLEQLVASTTPSLALGAALEAQGGIDRLDAESQSLLVEARSRAQQGVARILGYAAKSGGFTWYGGDAPSVEMTLIGLGGLAPAVEQGIVSARDPRITRSVQYLEGADLSGAPLLDAWRSWVLARVLASVDAKRAAPRVRASLEQAQAGSALESALAVLAADAAGIADESGTSDLVRANAKKAREALLAKQAVDVGDVYWRFPVGSVGAEAVLAHAALFANGAGGAGGAGGANGGADSALVTRVLELFARDDISTLDRATLLIHALPLVTAEAQDARAMTAPAVDVKAAFAPRGAGLAAQLPDGTTRVKLGAFTGVATLTADVALPYASAPPLAEGFAIKRRYYSVSSGAKVELGAKDVVRQGDVVFVELTVDLQEGTAKRGQRSAYSIVQDAVPAGFTPLQEDKEYRAAPLSLPLTHERVQRRSFQTDSVAFFVDQPAWWMGEPAVLGYVMRADFAGTYAAPPAVVEDMYQRRARGRTSAAQLVVVPSGGK
jgi:hypothetical protein